MSSSPPKVDRISALPDELLMHILTFLPTKHAFNTIVLSRRWTTLCHSLAVLNVLHFDDEGVQDKHAGVRFRRYVEAFILSKHHPIGTLRLISRSKCRDGYNRQFNMDEWLEAAIRRRIENLELSTVRRRPLPPRVLTSRTLVVLKLKSFDLGFGIVSVDLPSLKTLHLEESYLKNVDNLIKLLSGCLNLVDLSASAVFYLEQHVESTTRYEFTLPKLEKARICALAFLPFTVISNVKFLQIINTGYLGGVSKHMPMFQNLINIELCFGTFLGWHDIQKLLPYCPKLQTLVIQKLHGHIYQKKWAYTEPVPECVSFHLRTCSITNYRDTHEDFEFVTYILENARHLQVMTLHSAPNAGESEKDGLFKHLSQCLKISPGKIILDTKELSASRRKVSSSRGGFS